MVTSSFSNMRYNYLTFSSLTKLGFSPASGPRFFLVYTVCDSRAFDPIVSDACTFVYSWITFPLGSSGSVSSERGSAFAFLLSAVPLRDGAAISRGVFCHGTFGGRVSFAGQRFSGGLSIGGWFLPQFVSYRMTRFFLVSRSFGGFSFCAVWCDFVGVSRLRVLVWAKLSGVVRDARVVGGVFCRLVYSLCVFPYACGVGRSYG